MTKKLTGLTKRIMKRTLSLMLAVSMASALFVMPDFIYEAKAAGTTFVSVNDSNWKADITLTMVNDSDPGGGVIRKYQSVNKSTFAAGEYINLCVTSVTYRDSSWISELCNGAGTPMVYDTAGNLIASWKYEDVNNGTDSCRWEYKEQPQGDVIQYLTAKVTKNCTVGTITLGAGMCYQLNDTATYFISNPLTSSWSDMDGALSETTFYYRNSVTSLPIKLDVAGDYYIHYYMPDGLGTWSSGGTYTKGKNGSARFTNSTTIPINAASGYKNYGNLYIENQTTMKAYYYVFTDKIPTQSNIYYADENPYNSVGQNYGYTFSIGKTYAPAKIETYFFDGAFVGNVDTKASDFEWRSSNESVATIDTNGVIHPVSVGSFQISARLKTTNTYQDLDGYFDLIGTRYPSNSSTLWHYVRKAATVSYTNLPDEITLNYDTSPWQFTYEKSSTAGMSYTGGDGNYSWYGVSFSGNTGTITMQTWSGWNNDNTYYDNKYKYIKIFSSSNSEYSYSPAKLVKLRWEYLDPQLTLINSSLKDQEGEIQDDGGGAPWSYTKTLEIPYGSGAVKIVPSVRNGVDASELRKSTYFITGGGGLGPDAPNVLTVGTNSDNSISLTPVNPGKVILSVTSPTTGYFKYSSINVLVTVGKRPATVSGLPTSTQTVYAGNTAQLEPTTNHDEGATWTYKTSDESKATVDENGLVTFKASTGNGTVTITATSSESATYKSASGTVTYKILNKTVPTIRANNEALKDKVLKVAVGDTSTWTLSNSSYSGGTYSISGVTATTAQATVSGNTLTVKGVAEGEFEPTITLAKYGEQYAATTAKFKIKIQNKPVFTDFKSMTLTAGDAATALGGTVTTDGTVKYSSSDTKVATVSADGKVTPVAYGTATITIEALEGDKYAYGKHTVSILVQKKPTITVSNENDLKSFTFDQTPTISASANSGGTLSYSSGNQSILTVSDKGVITPKKVGETTVTIRAAAKGDYGGGVKTINVKITKGSPEISVSRTTVNPLYVTESESVNASISCGNKAFDEINNITYTSGDTSIATVEKVDGGVKITGVKAGTVKVTAAFAGSTNFNSASREITVTVLNKYDNTITVKCGDDVWGDTVEIVKEYGAKTIKPSSSSSSTGAYHYASSKPGVATISPTGVITPVAAGTTEITVTQDETTSHKPASRTITLTVKLRPDITVEDPIKLTMGDEPREIGARTTKGGAISYSIVSGEEYFTLADGKLTPVKETGEATAKVRVSVAAKGDYCDDYRDIDIIVLSKPLFHNLPETLTMTWNDPVYDTGMTITSDGGTVTTSSTNSTIAKISTDGKITAGEPGDATVTVSIAEKGRYGPGKAEVKVKVIKRTAEIKTEKDEYDLYVTDTMELDPQWNNNELSIEYSTDVDGLVKINSNGSVEGLKPGDVKVTLKTAENSHYTEATRTVTIHVANRVPVFTFGKSELSVKKNEDVSTTVTVTSNTDLSYESEDTTVATVEKTETGFSVHGVKVGSTRIKVSSAGKTGWDAGTNYVNVEVTRGVTTVSAEDITLPYQGTATIVPSRSPEDNSGTYTYEVTGGDGAIEFDENDPASFTATQGGTVTVKVTAGQTQEYLAGEKEITVTITPIEATLVPKEAEMAFTYLDEARAVEYITNITDGEITYSSTNTGKVTVDKSTGLVKPEHAGTADIIVEAAATPNYKYKQIKIPVTVNKKAPTFTGADVNDIIFDQTVNLGITVDSSVQGGIVSYANDETGIVSLSGGQIKGLEIGTATVTASVQETDDYTEGTYPITINVARKAPVFTFGGVTDNKVSLEFEATHDIKASVTSGNDRDHAEHGNLTYTSSDEDVLTVDADGVIHPVHAGTTEVVAHAAQTAHYLAGDSDAITVTVTQSTPRFENTDDMVITYLEDTEHEIKVPVTTQTDGGFKYTSNDTSVVTVDENTGVVTTVAKGSTTITVTDVETRDYVEESVAVKITVNPRTPVVTSKSDKYEGNINSETFNLGAEIDSGAKLVYKAKDPTVAEVDGDGNVTMRKDASTEIYITAPEKDSYTATDPNNVYTVTVKGIPTVPGTMVIEAEKGHDNNVPISWQAPENNGGHDITGYMITRKPASEPDTAYREIDTVGAYDTGYDDVTAVNGTVYTYVVHALNDIGTGDASNAVEVKPYRVPDASENLAAVATSHYSVDLTWNRPGYDGGDTITSYRIYVYTDAAMRHQYTSAVTEVVSAGADDAADKEYKTTVSGLETNTTYTFAVEAVNEATTDTNKAELATVEMITWNIPDAPLNLTGRPNNRGEYYLSWDAAQGGNGSPLQKYVLQYRENGKKEWKTSSDMVAPEETTHVLTGLDEGTLYYYRVYAVNTVGDGPVSEQIEGIPSLKPATPVLVDAEGGGNGVYITAKAGDDNKNKITAYNVYYKVHGASGAYTYLCALNTYTGALNSVFAEGLTNGVDYDVAITAVNELGESDKTEPKEIMPGKPSKVENVRVMPKAGRVINISYDASNGYGNPIEDYTLYIKTDISGVEGSETITTSQTSYRYYSEAINNSDTISVTVVANVKISSALTLHSDPSDTVTVGIGVPTTPVITDYDVDTSGLTLEWTPSEHNGSALKDYTIRITDKSRENEAGYTPDDFVIENKTRYADGKYKVTIAKGESVDKTGLVYPFESGGEYSAVVLARNTSGYSLPSEKCGFTYGAPSRPEEVESTVSDRTMRVTWKMPTSSGSGDIVGYYIYLNNDTKPTIHVTWEEIIKPMSLSSFMLMSNSGNTAYQIYIEDYRSNPVVREEYAIQDSLDEFSVDIDGLANGYRYTARVSAINEYAAESIAEGTAQAETPVTTADAPGDIHTKAVSGTSISVSWSIPFNDGGSDITGYEITTYKVSEKNYDTGAYEAVTESVVKTDTVTASELSATIDNLESGSAYQFAVAAVNSAGAGEKSDKSATTTRTFTKPSKPVITALKSGIGTEGSLPLEVDWEAPQDDGGSAVAGYDIYIGTMKMNTGGLISSSAVSYTINDSRLVSGKDYDVTVIVYNGVTGTENKNGVESDSKSVRLGTVPPPDNISLVQNLANNTLNVSWSYDDNTYAGEIASYFVYLNNNVEKISDTASVTLDNMTVGATYKVEISAIGKKNGEGSRSAAQTILYGTPDKVTGLTVTPAINGATARWNSVSGASGYEVYVNGTSIGTASTTEKSISGLEYGKTYKVTAAAKNSTGNGQESDAVTVSPRTYPDAVTVTNITPGIGSFEFDFADGANESAAVTGHKVYFANGSEASSSITGNHVKVTGVADGTTYGFYVLAVNTYGESGEVPSESGMYHVTTGVPAAPRNMEIVAGDKSATLVFDKSQDVSADRKVAGYYIYQKHNGTETLVEDRESIGDSRYRIDIEGLTNGETYKYYVQPYMKISGVVTEGEKSKELSVVPGTPTAPKLKPVVEGNGELKISWYAPESENGGNVERYVVYLNGIAAAETPDLETTIKSLQNGVEYSVTVSACNGVGEGAKSEPVTAMPKSVSEAVTDVKYERLVTESGGVGIKLTWNAPGNTGGVAVTDYVVSGEGEITVDKDARTATINNLKPGTGYVYTINPVTVVGEGKTYTTDTIVTANVPGAPVINGGESSGKSIYITWNAPADDGGNAIKKYNIYAQIAGAPESTPFKWETEAQAGTEMSKTIMGDFETGQQYNIYITAVNGVGEGTASRASRMQINDELEMTVPSEPLNVKASGGNRQITVTWDEPSFDGGSSITKYVIYAGGSESSMNYIGETESGNVFEYTERSLANGTTRYYKVKAVNAASADGGGFSQIVSATPANAPSAPAWTAFDNDAGASAYEMDKTGNTMTLSWSRSTGDTAGGSISYNIYVDGVLQGSTASTTYSLTQVKDKSGSVTYLQANAWYNIYVSAVNELGLTASSGNIRTNKKLNVRKGEGGTYESRYAEGKYAYIDADYDGEEDTVTEDVIPKPENVTLSRDNKHAVLTWEKPAYDGEITGYNVYINSSKEAGVTNGTKYEFDTDYGKPYVVYVTAYNASGEGKNSEFKYLSADVDAPTRVSASVAVKPFAVTEPSGNTVDVDVTWTVANNDATAYVVYVNGRANELEAGSNELTTNGSDISYTYPASVGSAYNFAVSSKYGDTESALTVTSEAVDLTETMAVPENLEITSAQNGTVSLTWDIDETGCTRAYTYYVYVNGERNADTAADTEAHTATLPLTRTALLKVAAVSANGTVGDASSPVKYVPASETQTYGTDTPAEPEIKGEELSEDGTSAVISWTPSGSNTEHTKDTEYVTVTVYEYDSEGNKHAIVENERVDSGSYTITTTPGTDYEVEVTPYDKDGTAGPPAVTVFTAKGGAEASLTSPTLTAELNEAKNKALLSWTGAENAERCDLLVNGTETVTDVKLTGGKYEYALTAAGKTTYTFILTAYAGSKSVVSNMASVNTSVTEDIDDSYLSGEPVVVNILSYSTQVKVYWKEPAKLTGEKESITKYKVFVDGAEHATVLASEADADSRYCDTVDFDSLTAEKTAVIQAYKTVSGIDIPVSATNSLKLSPSRNIVSDKEAFDEGSADAEKTNPDTNGDGTIDSGSENENGELRIPVATTDTGITVDVIDQYDNVLYKDCAVEIKDGAGELVIPDTKKISDGLTLKLHFKRTVYTSYIVTDISASELKDVSVDSLYMYPGDLNGDGVIDVSDVLALSSNMGKTGNDSRLDLGDLNTDSMIDVSDVIVLSSNLKKSNVEKKFADIRH